MDVQVKGSIPRILKLLELETGLGEIKIHRTIRYKEKDIRREQREVVVDSLEVKDDKCVVGVIYPIHICSVGPTGKEAAYKRKLYKIMKAWFLFSQSSETFHCYKYHVMT